MIGVQGGLRADQGCACGEGDGDELHLGGCPRCRGRQGGRSGDVDEDFLGS